MSFNPITLIDGYKLDHRRQYPEQTEAIYSNFTPRKSRVPGQQEVVLFGLQALLQRYFSEEMNSGFFFQNPEQVARKYSRRVNGYLGPNNVGIEHILALHRLGFLPLRVRAVPEGTLVPVGVPMLTIESTKHEFAWLTNYQEPLLSCQLWMPCTSSTTALRYRKYLESMAEKTGGDTSFVPFQGHDFSLRGMPGIEAAQLSGAGHLTSFFGTDTIPAIDFIEEYYEGDGLIGASVPATEHSVMCAGEELGEAETFRRLLSLYPEGIVSAVSDTWDLWRVLTEILPTIKPEIMARPGKLVIRPDSGDPVKIICGDPDKHGPPGKGVTELLWDTFGGTVTPTGYRLLDPHVGGIYGDSITFERAQAICEGLEKKGFASTNWVFGIGSFTYQFVTRDTYGFAMKATWVRVGGQERNIFKKPVTDDGEKFSAKGRLAVLADQEGRLVLHQEVSPELEEKSLLSPVWENGSFLRRTTFREIRQRLHPTWELP